MYLHVDTRSRTQTSLPTSATAIVFFYHRLFSIVRLLVLAHQLVVTFIETALVPRFPTVILATGMALAGLLSFCNGLTLDTVTQGRRGTKQLVIWGRRRPHLSHDNADGWRVDSVGACDLGGIIGTLSSLPDLSGDCCSQ